MRVAILALAMAFSLPVSKTDLKKQVFQGSFEKQVSKTVVESPYTPKIPLLSEANRIIDSLPVNHKSVAWRLKNPGNLRSFKTGKYRQFETLDLGYKALIRQLKLYTSGKSMWTDSTTTMAEYIHIYASEAKTKRWYIDIMCKGLNVSEDTKISGLDVDSLAKYHIKMEDVKLFEIMYR